MAINPSVDYSGQVDTSDPTGYPYGKAKNVTVSGDGTGTPLERSWVNDVWGWFAAFLDSAGITPSGTAEKVGASDMLDAFNKRIGTTKNLKTIGYEATFGSPAPEIYALDIGMGGVPTSAAMSADGLKLFGYSQALASVHQFTMTAAFDQSTATPDGITESVSATVNHVAFAFSADGNHFYILGNETAEDMGQYDCVSPWNIAGAAYIGDFPLTGFTTVGDMCFSNDGVYLFVLGYVSGAGVEMHRWTMSVPWELSSLSSTGVPTEFLEASSADYRGCEISADGTRLFLSTDVDIYEYRAGIPFGTGVQTGRSRPLIALGGPGAPVADFKGINFTPGGERLLLVNDDGDDLHSIFSSTVSLA